MPHIQAAPASSTREEPKITLYLIQELSSIDGHPTKYKRKNYPPDITHSALIIDLTTILCDWHPSDRNEAFSKSQKAVTERHSLIFKIPSLENKTDQGWRAPNPAITSLLKQIASDKYTQYSRDDTSEHSIELYSIEVWSAAQMNFCKRRNQQHKEHQLLLHHVLEPDPEWNDEAEADAVKQGRPAVSTWQGWDHWRHRVNRDNSDKDDNDDGKSRGFFDGLNGCVHSDYPWDASKG